MKQLPQAESTPHQHGFTIVELLIAIVIIAVLAAISIVAYNGIQQRARDTGRVQKVKDIAKALELYRIDNGTYPQIQDASGNEGNCGSQTENWGWCDRGKALSDALAPYMKLDPTFLSNATQGAYTYYYTSNDNSGYQMYGIMVWLEGSDGQNDRGYYSNAYEVGSSPEYCMSKYTGSNANWQWSGTNDTCAGGM